MTTPSTISTLFKGHNAGKMKEVHVRSETISHSISQSIQVSQLRQKEIEFFYKSHHSHTRTPTPHTHTQSVF